MSLATDLRTTFESFQKEAPPDIVHKIGTANANFQASFNSKSAIQVGDKLPSFRLPNAIGKEVNSADLLAEGPILVTFYRGEWCPFCNVTLRALQKHLVEFKSKRVTLVAISPELPNRSLTMSEKHELQFDVLSDTGNKFARQLGLTFQQSDSLRPVYQTLGIDLKARNGDDSFELPIPATLLIDQQSVVRNAFIEPDFTKRLDPSEALKWIDAL